MSLNPNHLSLISLITASYNKEKYISETIVSVLEQTYFNWELIIVDDHSTDETIKIINAFQAKDNRIKLVVNDVNRGANFCRNIGIEKAQGEFVIFLDADDLLSGNCLEERIKAIENTDLDFCVFTMGVFKKRVGDCDYKWIPDSKNPLQDFLQHKLPWSILQPIWKKEFLIKLKGFDEQFKRLQDVELHTRALLHDNVRFRQMVGNPDCFYRIDEGRKNFNTYDFLKRWIDSSNLYCAKFSNQTKLLNKESFLNGTLYKTYLQVLYQYKINSINKSQFVDLEDQLFCTNKKMKTIFRHKSVLFYFGKIFALLPFRIPGVNWLISKLIVI